ncbi:hypothetical protein V474_23430 [Novosphingobium barchaimii LL02]|uniref:Uncharacterized protein n=1 Tax=Novosphingobium barchaimii LL02 TaxID=1114963 RepID=A0A0J7XPB5_9SPHN|nr:hypothetical protein V474_23430 [Novosphingobium barchaimii LL02]
MRQAVITTARPATITAIEAVEAAARLLPRARSEHWRVKPITRTALLPGQPAPRRCDGEIPGIVPDSTATTMAGLANTRGEYWSERVALMQFWSDELERLRDEANILKPNFATRNRPDAA